jgi:hypothetical protein
VCAEVGREDGALVEREGGVRVRAVLRGVRPRALGAQHLHERERLGAVHAEVAVDVAGRDDRIAVPRDVARRRATGGSGVEALERDAVALPEGDEHARRLLDRIDHVAVVREEGRRIARGGDPEVLERAVVEPAQRADADRGAAHVLRVRPDQVVDHQ